MLFLEAFGGNRGRNRALGPWGRRASWENNSWFDTGAARGACERVTVCPRPSGTSFPSPNQSWFHFRLCRCCRVSRAHPVCLLAPLHVGGPGGERGDSPEGLRSRLWFLVWIPWSSASGTASGCGFVLGGNVGLRDGEDRGGLCWRNKSCLSVFSGAFILIAVLWAWTREGKMWHPPARSRRRSWPFAGSSHVNLKGLKHAVIGYIVQFYVLSD